jgi:hypothetical protein
MIVGLVVAVASATGRPASVAGSVSLFIVVAVAWALGGPAWTAPLLALQLVAHWTRTGEALDDVFPTYVGSLLVVLAYGHSSDPGLFVPYLTTLAASGGIAVVRARSVRSASGVAVIAAATLAPLVPALALGTLPLPLIALASTVGILFFLLLQDAPMAGRRLLATLSAGGVAWLALG